MHITVSISNKSFWVPTWKMLTEYARRSSTSSSKTARTNPDGTVSVEIDHALVPVLLAEINEHNTKNRGINTLTLLANADDKPMRQRA